MRDGVITLEKMYFADEIRSADEVAPSGAKVEKRELDMAAELIDRFAGAWQPDKYRDTYRERLLEIIKAKRKGEEVHVEQVREPEQPEDLMEALRASLEAAKRERRGPKKAKARSSSSGPKRRERSKSSRR